MDRFQGRNATACYNCHRQKVKCTGEQPCQRCTRQQRSCVYPGVRDSVIPVPESYLQNLDRSLKELTDAILTSSHHHASSRPPPPSWTCDRKLGMQSQPDLPHVTRPIASDSLAEDSTSEAFIRRLKEAAAHSGSSTDTTIDRPTTNQQEYSPTPAMSARDRENDESGSLFRSEKFQLPPYSYALHLVARAEQEFGDCHTFLRKSFLKRFHATYRGHQSETLDRKWMCRLFFVLALAECTTTTKQPIHLAPNGVVTSPSPTDFSPSSEEVLRAGVELFENGLALLSVTYEEPTVDDVEALNLASHCCYILNRRLSAYAYAGQSVRLAQCLGLDHPTSTSFSNVLQEHRKRVWWTAYCVDRMISTELALPPACISTTQELGYPDSSSLTAEEKEEFYDPDLLTALIKLCQIKCDVVETISRLKIKDVAEPYEVLRQCLQGLDRCGRDMPARVFSGSDSLPENRICSSLALRYHQCYILLLRPILLHQFTFILQNRTAITVSSELCAVNNMCLQAARSNARIILELAQAGELVRYGYWDSAHLFSCLSVLALAQAMLVRHPNVFQCTEEDILRDADTYRKARSVLVHMAQTGNIASKQHVNMLEEVERHGTLVSALSNSASLAVSGTPLALEANNTEIEMNFEDWARLTGTSGQDSEGLDLFNLT